MADILRFLAAAVLVLVFGWAAAAKALRPGGWRSALAVYRLPRLTEPIVFVAAPVAEIATVALVLTGATKAAGALSTGLLCSFCAALLRARSEEGDRLPCGCFGGNQVIDYRLLLLRNVVLLVPALLLLLGPNRPALRLPTAVDPIPALLVLVGAAALGWTAFEVARALRRGRPG